MASKVELDLIANTEKAKRDIASLSDSARGSFNAIKAAAAAAIGIFAGKQVIDAFVDVTNAAAEQEKAVQELESALKRTGDFSVEASRKMQDFASNLQDTTTFGDETTIKMLGLAKAFGVTNDDAIKLVEAASELSSTFNMSFESAVRNLGKTYSGLAGELGETVGPIRELTKEQLKNGDAIKLVLAQYSGNAAEAALTFSGRIERMSNAWGDLKEAIGENITQNPQVLAFISGLQESFIGLTKFVKENQETISDLLSQLVTGFASQIPKAVRAIGELAGQFIDLAIGVNDAYGGIQIFFKEILDRKDSISSALKIISAPIDSIAFGIAVINQEIEKRKLEDLKDDLKEATELQQKLVRANPDSKFLQNVINHIDDIKTQIKDTQAEIDLLEETGKVAALSIDNAGERLGKELGEGISDAITRGQKLEDLKVELEIKNNQLADNLDKLAQAVGDNTDATRAATQGGDGSSGIGGPGPGEDGFSSDAGGFGSVLDRIKAELFGDGSAIDGTLTDEQRKALQESNPEGLAAADKFAAEQSKMEQAATTATAALVKSIFDALAVAADNPQQAGAMVVGGVSGAAADFFLPGSGGAVSSIVSQLAMGGEEQSKAMVEGLVEGIPLAIDAFVEAAPALITALAENSGEIITALAAGSVDIAVALAKALVIEVPPILVKELVDGIRYQLASLAPGFDMFRENFGEALGEAGEVFKNVFTEAPVELVQGIASGFEEMGQQLADLLDLSKLGEDLSSNLIEGANSFIQAIIDGAEGIVKALDPTNKGGVKSAIDKGKEWVNKIIPGGATGGIVGGSGNADTELFRLMPGELIVDVNRTKRLDTAIKALESGSGQNSAAIIAAINRLADMLQQPMTVQTTTQVNQQAFADIMLTLSRTNARTA